MGEHQILGFFLLALICYVSGSINLITFDESFSQCSSVDQQQIIGDGTCSSVSFGSGTYLVQVDCISPTISSAWTFNLYQSSQFGCINIRPYRLITGSSSGAGCFIAVISYTEYQYFSIRCDSSIVDTSPSLSPSLSPTTTPTFTPTVIPSNTISHAPTAIPTSSRPTVSPSRIPSFIPTMRPTLRPTYPLTNPPTASPTYIPGLSYTAIFTSFSENCDLATVPNNSSSFRRSYNSGSIPFKGNCSSVPLFIRFPHNNGTMREVTNFPGRVHCYDTSNWIMELYNEPTCADETSLILQISSSSTGCFSRSNISFGYNNMSINNQTILFSVVCDEVFKSQSPTLRPSARPSFVPSTLPTVQPSTAPSVIPTQQPSFLPSVRPTAVPTLSPTSFQPTVVPTALPSPRPSLRPSIQPSFPPTRAPSTSRPSISLRPTTFAPTRPTSVLARIRFFVADAATTDANNIQAMSFVHSTAITSQNNDSTDDDASSFFEGFISSAEDYSLSKIHDPNANLQMVKPFTARMTTASTSTAETSTTSCTSSLSKEVSLRELGSWTVSRGTCVAINSLSSISGSIASNLNRSIASFSITCIPRSGGSSSSSTSWQVSTYTQSSSCQGSVAMLYTGASSCACGYATVNATSSTVSLLAMMVDCDFSDASDSCDANEVSNASNSNLFSVTTREGLQNLIGVLIAAGVVVLFLLLGMRRAWRKYLLHRGEDPDAYECSAENCLHLWDVLVGTSLLHFCRYCCACVCCCCACWMAPSGSVTPRDGDEDDDDDDDAFDEEEGGDVFDVNHRRHRQERRGSVGVAAVLTMADIRMVDDLRSETTSNANDLSNMTLAEAVAIRRRASTSSTTSTGTSTLQVVSRPYDDHLDFALPTAELSSRPPRQRRRQRQQRRRRSTFRGELFRWLFSTHQDTRAGGNASTVETQFHTLDPEAVVDIAAVPPIVGTPVDHRDNDNSSRNNSTILPSPRTTTTTTAIATTSPRRRVEIVDELSSDNDSDSDSDTSDIRGRHRDQSALDSMDAWDQFLQSSTATTSNTTLAERNNISRSRLPSQTHVRHHNSSSSNRSRAGPHPSARSSREIDYVHSSVDISSVSLPASPTRPSMRHQVSSRATATATAPATARDDAAVSTSQRNGSNNRRRSSVDNRTDGRSGVSHTVSRSTTSGSPRRTRR